MLRLNRANVASRFGGLLRSGPAKTSSSKLKPWRPNNQMGKRMLATSSAAAGNKAAQVTLSSEEIANQQQHANLLRFITAFRTYGHLEAQLDPLGQQQKG